jgi:YgiT-type zinc finger domain-containing protein
MKGFCPSCEKESELTRIRRVENLNIKGEMIPVPVDYFVCTECGEEFDNPAPDYDPLAIAYRDYRRR